MIRNILVGLDGSRSATGLAIEWAKRFGAELTGVAVIDDVSDRDPFPRRANLLSQGQGLWIVARGCPLMGRTW